MFLNGGEGGGSSRMKGNPQTWRNFFIFGGKRVDLGESFFWMMRESD
jgi:hypothetical protein